MKVNLHSPIEEVQVQIIPLIDVIFCILTFFLLAALQFTRQQAINVDLPRAGTGSPPQLQQQRLIVTLDAGGQIFVEKQPVQSEQLTETLRAYFQINPDGTLVLNASRSASYDQVVQVLDKLREVGGDRVSLATLAGTPEQPASTIPLEPLNPDSTPLPAVPGTP